MTREERQTIMAKIEHSPLCDTAKWVLEAMVMPRKCTCGSNGMNRNGEISFIFQTTPPEQVEQAINASGIAMAVFRADTSVRHNCIVHRIKVSFLAPHIWCLHMWGIQTCLWSRQRRLHFCSSICGILRFRIRRRFPNLRRFRILHNKLSVCR